MRFKTASPSESELASRRSFDGFNYFISNNDRFDFGMLLSFALPSGEPSSKSVEVFSFGRVNV